eukprot:scaffold347_cov239-Pinguiococcus_pyrenoidosus.AAC.28
MCRSFASMLGAASLTATMLTRPRTAEKAPAPLREASRATHVRSVMAAQSARSQGADEAVLRRPTKLHFEADKIVKPARRALFCGLAADDGKKTGKPDAGKRGLRRIRAAELFRWR